MVLFNIVSLPAIWVGYFLHWRFVRNFCFRSVHLLLIAYVAVQALTGQTCPLTTWENDLRVKAGTDTQYAGSFVAHWVQRVLFYEADERVFSVAYSVFFGLVLLTLFLVKPNRPRWRCFSR